MNVVEAIDAWIDEVIDDLTDDELEDILEILDVVDASELTDLDVNLVNDDDLEVFLDLYDGSVEQQAYADRVLRAACYGEDFDPANLSLAVVDSEDDKADAADLNDDEPDGHLNDVDDDPDLDEPDGHLNDVDDDPDLDEPDDHLNDVDDDPDLNDDHVTDVDDDPDLNDDHVTDVDDDPDLNDDEPDDDPADDDLVIEGEYRDDYEVVLGDGDDPDLNDDDQDDDYEVALDDGDDDQDDDYEVALDDEPDDDPADDDHVIDGEYRDDYEVVLGDGDDPDLNDDEPDDDQDDDYEVVLGDGDVGALDPGTLDADFLSDIDDAEQWDAAQATLDADATQLLPVVEVDPVPLRAFDELGPSFLAEPEAEPVVRRRASALLLPVFLALGLAVFAFGMYQLVTSLDEEETVADAEPTPIPEQAESPEPDSPEVDTSPTVEPATADPSAPTPAPGTQPDPPRPMAIILTTGDVAVASYETFGMPAEIRQVYSQDDELRAATNVAWLPDGLAIVDVDGNVLTVDTNAATPQPELIYEASDDLAEAAQIALLVDVLAIRTADGDVTAIPTNGQVDPDDVQVLWNADEMDAQAVDMAISDNRIAVVSDDGNAQMIVASSNNFVVPMWSAESQPPAFNVANSPIGFLLGIGQGAVARYNFDDTRELLEVIWDPTTGREQAAIGYGPVAEEDTAVVLGDGAIVIADAQSEGRFLWDPSETEIRAFSVQEDDGSVVVLLETGSVVRIQTNDTGMIESIWDITDETRSPALRVVVDSSPS